MGRSRVGRRRALVFFRNIPDGLYIIGADGTGLRRLFPSNQILTGPAWSPDGKWIAFAPELSRHGIRIIRPNGSSLRRLTRRPDFSPSWSPNGQRIAFTRMAAREFFKILTMSRSGKRVRQITNDDDSDPDWSPDGKKIVFAGFETGLHTVNPNGTDRTPIHNAGITPSWQPRCTVTGFGRRLNGTADRDLICGGAFRNVIRGFASADAIFAGGGNDGVRGHRGRNVLVGGTGRDRLVGGPGADLMNGRDGISGNDILVGGGGRDICISDRRDVRVGCS